MGINKYKPHLYVLPEDEANNDIYNGFVLHPNFLPSANIQALPSAGGWKYVLDKFVDDLLPDLGKYPACHILLLIDFDTQYAKRFKLVQKKIPAQYRDRVFILGALSEPEKLKSAMEHASSESVGMKLAEDCANDTSTTWNHKLLRHNQPEVERLRKAVKPFLFV